MPTLENFVGLNAPLGVDNGLARKGGWGFVVHDLSLD